MFLHLIFLNYIFDKDYVWPTKLKIYLAMCRKNLPTPNLEDFLNLDF